MSSSWKSWTVRLALLFALSAAAGLPAQSADGVTSGSKDSTQQGSGREALRRASRLVEEVKGQKGEQRDQALQRAERAYREVIADYSSDPSVCARAWFEVGELQRRLSNLSAASQAYGRALELDPDRFGVRALLQQAHMQRRLSEWKEAVASYRKVVARAPDSARAHTARLWVGGCLQSMGDLPGAIREFSKALGETEKPLRVIELTNKLAKALVTQDDLDGAAVAIARADAVAPSGSGAEAERLRKAAAAMSARKALQRARDRAAQAHRDAAQLEHDRAATGK